MQHLDVGESRVLSVTFANEDGDATDPTTVTLTIVAPDGTTTTPVPTHPGVGVYEHLLDPDQSGPWQYDFAGQGNGIDAHEGDLLMVGLSQPVSGPCEPWCSWEQVLAVAPASILPALATLDARDQERAVDWATTQLYGLTGGRYPGVCVTTFGICRS